MTRIAFKAISCWFFSLLAIACGDPGDPGFGAQARFDDVAKEEQVPLVEASAGQFTDELDQLGVQSRGAEELAVIAPAGSTNLIEQIVSGDAVIELIGGGEVAVGQLSEAELAELEAQSCDQSFALEIRAAAIAATGICGAFEYDIDTRLIDDGRIEGEITIQHEGVSLRVGVDGVITSDRLVVVFGHERPFPPNFHDFWEEELIADLR